MQGLKEATLKCTVLPLPLVTPADTGRTFAGRNVFCVEESVMKAAGPAAEVVDRTDQLDTADTAVRATDDTAVVVDDVDVDNNTADDAAGDHTSD